MQLQILLIGLFVVNMVLIWLTVPTKKFEWYRATGVLIFAIIPFLSVFFEQPRFELDFFWWRIAGGIAVVLGFGIAGWARLELKRAGMWANDIPNKLITTGPYQYVRHPQYLGLVFIWVGWWWGWAAVYAFYFGVFILALTWIEAYLEEKFILERSFGDQFREYRKHAGMFWIK